MTDHNETTGCKGRQSGGMKDSRCRLEFPFHQLVEALPQLVWITAADGTHEFFNGKWYEYTGIDPDAPAEQYLALAVHPDDYQHTVDRWNYSLRTGEAYEIEYRLRQGNDGSYHWFLGRALPFRDDEGRIRRWFGTCTDIDPQKQVEENLKRAMEDLIRTNRDLERFALIASRDLQKPLRLMAGYVRLIAERYRGKLDRKGDRYVSFAERGAKRMQRLLDDLLAVSRVARGAAFQPVDLNEVFASAAGRLSEQIRAAGAEVTSEVLPVVTGDKTQLTVLLENLLDNALRYRKPDTPLIVRISARKAEGFWELSVRDNGIGIEPQHFGRIFHIFQRRLHTREKYGTGIGLALCRKIAERHHGRIWVDSEPGKGSTFYVALPAEGNWLGHAEGGPEISGIPGATGEKTTDE